MRHLRLTTVLLALAFAAFTLLSPNPAQAASAAEIRRDANKALQNLYKKSSSAKALGEQAKSILVFPKITKGGFMVGGQYGEGALLKEEATIAYFSTVSVSYGMQVGVQTYGYVLFFMTDAAREYLTRSDGWELGTGPSIVVVDEGVAGGLSTTTARADVYAFIFDQKGLMGGLGLQGTKITQITK